MEPSPNKAHIGKKWRIVVASSKLPFLLAVPAVFLLWGCGILGGGGPTPAPVRTVVARTPVPTATPTPPPLVEATLTPTPTPALDGPEAEQLVFSRLRQCADQVAFTVVTGVSVTLTSDYSAKDGKWLVGASSSDPDLNFG